MIDGNLFAVPLDYISVDTRGIAFLTGSRIKVMHLVQEKNACGLTIEQIHEGHNHLSLSQIYAAFAYYYDHQAEVDAQIEQSALFVEQMRAQATGQVTRAELEERLRRKQAAK